jgi:hypothetical protein
MVEKDKTVVKRKKRNDRTHIIYRLAVANMEYIGITAKTQSTVLKSVRLRFSKHGERARNENKPWPLYKAIRKYGIDAFELEILETVRGKALAHTREVELIKIRNPKLNLASAK